MNDDAFGFKPKKVTSKLAAIIPREPSSLGRDDLERIDQAGRTAGFTSREAGARLVPRRKKSVGPTVTINTRVPEDVAERFIEFCDANRLAYWEGIRELMDRAKV
ncbi:hypothetical protein NKW55_11020 [Gluconobacter kondonii]|uniref:hypothetical protein n=1 Tax=Gluconobacter kondonii TaxID=941463 RepID=UPI00209CFB08|nr:hypothetical protein [Gluconobacter kondonii]MCP1237131.1 hypothetical protein [Gluconobacter kondonii]